MHNKRTVRIVLISVLTVVVLGVIAYILLPKSITPDNRSGNVRHKPIASDNRIGNVCHKPITPDNRSGDFCPKCKSSDVYSFTYGLFELSDSLHAELKENKEILGGCVISDDNPKYRCGDCSYEWGNFVDEFRKYKR